MNAKEQLPSQDAEAEMFNKLSECFYNYFLKNTRIDNSWDNPILLPWLQISVGSKTGTRKCIRFNTSLRAMKNRCTIQLDSPGQGNCAEIFSCRLAFVWRRIRLVRQTNTRAFP